MRKIINVLLKPMHIMLTLLIGILANIIGAISGGAEYVKSLKEYLKINERIN